MAKLIILLHDGSRIEHVLGNAPVTFGRDPAEATIRLPDAHISRKHASILRRGQDYVLEDLGSANGTLIGGKRVRSKKLEDGDEVHIGTTRIVFVTKESAENGRAETHTDRAGNAREIIRHVEDIAEPLSLKISTAQVAHGVVAADRTQSKVPASREARMFFILYQICGEVLAAVSLDAVLRRALSLCFDVINAERGVLFVRTDKGIQPVAAFRRGEGFVPPSDVHYSSTIVQHVVDTRVAMLSRDALTEDDLRVAVSIVRLNIRSALCVPLWLEQESLGAIYLDNCAASYAFTPQDMELLTAIAHVVAVRMRQDRLARRLQQEEFLRANLARYQPPDVVEMILREGTVRLGIRVRPVSVLFADLVDSTRLAERAGPEATAEILNRFYEIVARVVFEERGHVNNYIGDGVISIFNATIDLEDHPAAAVRAALRIVRETVRFARENPRFPVQVRVGVNTGEAAVGNVGAEGRIQYTALGDPVNAAERLCKLADPNGVVVGHETYEHAARMFRFLPLGEVTLKGRDRPLAAYALEIAP